MIWHNPLAEMYGPTFLLFYAFVIVVVLAASVWWAKSLDTSATIMRPLLVPSSPDPFQIAYLRAGSHEVVRVAAYKLLKQGYLITQPKANRPAKSTEVEILANPETCAYDSLLPIERILISFFSKPGTMAELFASSVSSKVAAQCVVYDEWMQSELLIPPVDWPRRAGAFRMVGLLVILAVGLYKLTAALHNGHSNVGFLIAFGLLGSVALAFAGSIPRQTNRGRELLDRTRQAYGNWTTAFSPNGSSIDAAVLCVAVNGMSSVTGKSHNEYLGLFAVGASSSGGACGGAVSGCGSGGGSSCGGGGGSSGGGGGCGGCGGGH